MSPTSRNTLMIGGALILIALLLVCGPLSGPFGGGGSQVAEPPAVAAGPPADSAGVLGAAAVGALAGANLGESAMDSVVEAAIEDPCAVSDELAAEADSPTMGSDTDCPPVDGAEAVVVGVVGVAGDEVVPDEGESDLSVVAPVVAAVAAVAVVAAGAADGIGGGSGLAAPAVAAPLGAVAVAVPVVVELPAVGAAGPTVTDGMEVAAVPVLDAGAANAEFDRAVASAVDENAGVGAAGKVVDRFAPPVAAPPAGNLQVASSLDVGRLIQPCDTPGSGCRNLAATAGGTPPPPPMGGNPPIIPGRLPPVPTDAP